MALLLVLAGCGNNGGSPQQSDTDANVYYYACLIKDATACCSQGIEFVLTEEYSCPEDYPEIGEEICVVGEFATYEEDGNLLCTLANARLI